MRKKVLLSLMSLIMFIACKSKNEVVEKPKEQEINYIPYYLKVYEADSLYVVKDYKKSYKILDSLFKNFNPIDLNGINEVLTYYKLKIILNEKIDKDKIKELISVYGYTDELFINDSLFNIYTTQSKNNLLKNYNLYRNIYINKLDLSLRNEIKEMKDKDQLYRKQNYKENIEKQNEIDLINQKRLIEIFNQKGFPNKDVLGNFSIDNSNVDIRAILLHTKDSIREKYFMPKILDFVKLGKANPECYANLYDQFLLYNGSEQYYGSYANKTDLSINVLNKRRKSIGMPNYNYLKWRTHILHPEEEIEFKH